ncbi:ABC transporter substrate-binding protein [Brevundimonas nasdae]|jgi:NitT/TauT family transport system substrate-binding protein|uniref:ABC transporter substrate-binding protein n=1 Tax=Brevundimonas nasdae TaxID=172043 RepID=A0ABX8TD17_9CAUL|nr:ABC transporter substrate-binding protein [Brevundimonas nasdae]MBK6023772.1 ABC transporter substrate-binding protein [Brevundimonas nasdae]QYC09067.1 ABC transporter substrate-binding protein [Brevundimonas nasdae]QYC15117.1 ABC transporter substrate-binding protein [Brevundimonas nasdae]
MNVRGNRPLLNRRRALLAGGAAALGVTALGLRACDRSPAAVDEQGRVRLRFATDWRAQAEHGGFYQALASGAYEKRGLNVQIVQGGPGVNVPQLLAAGAVELGMGSNSFIPMNLVAAGAPVKAVAAFFQKDPQVLIAHPDPALKSIADLKGRPILLADASVNAFWVWLKAKYGFTDDEVRKYTFNLAPFLSDKRAVQQGYLTSEPYTIEQQAGFEPKVFLLADEGYPSYATMVLAPTAFARDNGATLRSFIAASAEGWRDYIRGDASAADALIRKDNPDMTQDILDQARAKLRDNDIVDGGDAALYGLGSMTEERWKAFFDVTSQAGVYDANLNWRDAFTNNYLPGRG